MMTSCLILAAGSGTRLRPHTADTPKGMVPLLGKPLVCRQIEVLKACGIEDIAIVSGYKAEKFASLGCQLFHNDDYAQTNMVESLFTARSFLEQATGDVLISYGDIVYEQKNLTTVLETPGEVVVMVDEGWLTLWSTRNEDPLLDAETLKLSREGQIVELGKKPRTLADIEGQYTGLIKISHRKLPEFIDFYDGLDRSVNHDGRPFEQLYLTSFLQLLINAGWALTPARVQHGWLEVDTVGDLQCYERLAASGKLGQLWRADE